VGDLKEIVEPFFTSNGFDPGLGLSVDRSIISAHGGKPWTENNPARGVTFHFTLPLGNGN
jgi:two-component system sensor kinase FixL